jgi:hypothetical protein
MCFIHLDLTEYRPKAKRRRTTFVRKRCFHGIKLDSKNVKIRKRPTLLSFIMHNTRYALQTQLQSQSGIANGWSVGI